jgi:hypothetical protein
MTEWNVRVLKNSRVRRDPRRFALSRGIREIDDSAYEREARIPLEFEPLSDADISVRQEDRALSRSWIVGVVSFSNLLLDGLRAASSHSRPEALSETLPSVVSELAEQWTIARTPRELGLGHNPPGMLTVTRDPQSGLLVGLHVDTFESYNSDRTSAGNRLSINIGRGPRYFLFVPHDYPALACAGAQSRAQSVVRRFFECRPDTAVVRVCINPGEGYVAPTESIVHDASSIDSGDRDVHVTALGCFEPRAVGS